MTPYEKADRVMERIEEICERYLLSNEYAVENTTDMKAASDLASEAARVQYNFEKISELYDLDPAEFAARYDDEGKESIDILVEWLLCDVS